MILYQGLLRSPASWARVGRGYIKAFLSLGVEIKALSQRGFRYDPRFPLPEGVEEASLGDVLAGPAPSVGLGFLHPPLVERLLGVRKINLFVWESDRLPPGWVEELDRGADLVVVPSAFTREAVVSSGLPEGKVAVVPYGYDRDAMPDAMPPENGGAPSARRPFTFLSVMSPHWRKGVKELLTAYRRIFTPRDDVLLKVKSTYDPGLARRRRPFEIPSWEEVFKDCGFAESGAPRIDMDLRILDDAGAMALYAESDVYVQPSWGESFGLAMLEAMCTGLPAVATGWGGHLDFFPPGDDLLPFRLSEEREGLYADAPGARVALPDVDVLSERLRWHFEHREASRALGARAREAVSHLTWLDGARGLYGVLPAPIRKFA